MKKYTSWILLVIAVVIGTVVGVAQTTHAFLDFLGVIISAVVGVVIGAVTVNPGAGMAATMMLCVLICSGTAPTTTTRPPSGLNCDSFTVSPSTRTSPGDVTLSWNIPNATTVSINQGIGSVPKSGTRTVSVSATKAFTLTAEGQTSSRGPGYGSRGGGGRGSSSAGRCTKAVEVQFPPQTCRSFTATPVTSPQGNTRLSWDLPDAAQVSIDQGIGSVPKSGTRIVNVTGTMIFTLTGINAAGQCKLPVTVEGENPMTAILEVQSPTAGISWTSNTIDIIAGHEIELRWSSINATTCSGSNFSTGGASNNQNGVNPTTQPTVGSVTTYTLTCNDNDPGTSPVTDQLQVTASETPPTLSSVKTTVRTNEPFTLTWNLNGNDPAQCIITGPGSTLSGAGSITAQTGNTTLTAVGTATYVLECPGGEDSVSIQVLPQVFES